MAETDTAAIQDTVIGIVAAALRIKPETISADSHLEKDLGADSLDGIAITEKLEGHYGIEISNEQAQSFMTIRAIVEGLETLIADRPSP